jgi:hypothetical protein
MIDRQALEKIAETHARAMASDPLTLEIHLLNGEVYCVNAVAEVLDNYFVALVYPKDASSPEELEDAIPRNDKGQPIFDRAIIPYESMSYILLTAGEGQGAWKLGFSPNAA